MRADSYCMSCLVQKQEQRIRDFKDEDKKTEFMRQVLELIGSCDPELSAPSIIRRIAPLYEAYWGKPRDMEREKKEFNEFLLEMEPDLEQASRREEDPLKAALNYARMGNYIDFTTVKNVSREGLLELFDTQKEKPVDQKEYDFFRRDLETGRKLVYLPDNCGEIVLDKILIRLLKELYPKLDILVLVRGVPVVNDVDMEAAREVGLDGIAEVLENGSAIAGTDLKDISEKARKAVEEADLIISKGQGNFETIHGCGLNIYYLFLCKCGWFMKRFGAGMLDPMFLNERRI